MMSKNDKPTTPADVLKGKRFDGTGRRFDGTGKRFDKPGRK